MEIYENVDKSKKVNIHYSGGTFYGEIKFYKNGKCTFTLRFDSAKDLHYARVNLKYHLRGLKQIC